MDAIIDAARNLARMLAADQRTATLRALEDQVLNDGKMRSLLEEYEKSRMSLDYKERNMQPVSPDEKRAHADVTQRVHAVPALLELARAQADYAQMMDAVNREIHAVLRPDAG